MIERRRPLNVRIYPDEPQPAHLRVNEYNDYIYYEPSFAFG